MNKTLHSAIFLLLIYIYNQPVTQKAGVDSPARFYSKAVKDTFSVSVSLSTGYDSTKEERYPVVDLLDANVYFDIMATRGCNGRLGKESKGSDQSVKPWLVASNTIITSFDQESNPGFGPLPAG